MKTTVYIGMSLDGFIARTNGDLDWLMSSENTSREVLDGYSEFISKVDAIIIGRGTFEKVLTFPSWPYDRKVFVLSTTIRHVPEALKEKIIVLAMKPRELLTHLSKQGYSNLYVDGGKVIQSFLNEDCIDRLIITTIPVLIGSGIPLFGDLAHDLHFKHLHTEAFPNGLVKSYYERKRN